MISTSVTEQLMFADGTSLQAIFDASKGLLVRTKEGQVSCLLSQTDLAAIANDEAAPEDIVCRVEEFFEPGELVMASRASLIATAERWLAIQFQR